MIIRNRVIETLKASPLNSRRSERPADSRYGVITTLKGSPVLMGDHRLNRRATPTHQPEESFYCLDKQSNERDGTNDH